MGKRPVISTLANWRIQPEERELIVKHWPSELRVVFRTDMNAADLEIRAHEFQVIVGEAPVELLRSATGLRLLHVLGHGIDALEHGETAEILRSRNVCIASAKPASGPIAEYAIMSLIALNRRLMPIHHALAYHGDWSEDLVYDRMRGSLGGEIEGSTLCILGFGAIGKAIAKKAKSLGMRVGALTNRPHLHNVDADLLDYIGHLKDAPHYLASSHHLVVALPLTDQTRGLVSRQLLQRMPQRSFLVNIARSEIVDLEAVVEALELGRLAGAAIDVWPNQLKGSYPSRLPLHQFNVIMTPHYSGNTLESRRRAIITIGDNLRRFLANQPIPHTRRLGM